MIIFSGNANKELAQGFSNIFPLKIPIFSQEIANNLNISLGNLTVSRFADGEVSIQVLDNVRGKDVFIIQVIFLIFPIFSNVFTLFSLMFLLIQPTSPPVNENLMELLLLVGTMRRASARNIHVVIPYYGYARQDRKVAPRVPISAADVARLLETVGVDRVISVDLHSGQIQVFFIDFL